MKQSYICYTHILNYILAVSHTISTISNPIFGKWALSISTKGKYQTRFTYPAGNKSKAAYTYWLYQLCIVQQEATMKRLILLRHMKPAPRVIHFNLRRQKNG